MINLALNKVKAHTRNTYNEKADQLAKQVTQMEIIKWNNTAIYRIKTLPIWNDIVIDIATRSFVKKINQSQNLNKWTQQKRIEKTFEKQIQSPECYDWKSFWKNTLTKGATTSFKDNNRKGFLLKLIHNELPTMDRLEIRRPDLYKQDKLCSLCNKEEEIREHLFECKELESRISQAWEKTVKKIIKEVKMVFLENKEEIKTTNIMDLKDNQITEFIKKMKEKIFRSK